MLHTNYRTALGARNLALNLDVDRWRFRLETVFEAAMFIAVMGILVVGWYSAAGWLETIRGMM